MGTSPFLNLFFGPPSAGDAREANAATAKSCFHMTATQGWGEEESEQAVTVSIRVRLGVAGQCDIRAWPVVPQRGETGCVCEGGGGPNTQAANRGWSRVALPLPRFRVSREIISPSFLIPPPETQFSWASSSQASACIGEAGRGGKPEKREETGDGTG